MSAEAAAAVDELPRGELGVPELDEPFWRLVADRLVEVVRATAADLQGPRTQ